MQPEFRQNEKLPLPSGFACAAAVVLALAISAALMVAGLWVMIDTLARAFSAH